ncbi:MAG TPA: YaaR family protein [Spirochaetota bacterium]|nr:YaaR family protein [Spirochaetota bacterium]HOL57837.1 YaaR family protein [Spirochaetota bacterium]HPP05428.1 YaaR family protein [Spirochaetota bacterium]
MEKINENNYLYQQNSLATNKANVKKKNEIKSIKEKNKTSFFDFLKTEEIKEENDISLQKEELINLLKEIGKQGEKLKKNLTLDNLTEYKKMVKKFLLSAIELSEKVERKTLWNSFKKEKVTKIHLSIIDKELNELTKYFFEEQRDVFKIAAKIDKIEGILIDISK